jgi:hypothetical protein
MPQQPPVRRVMISSTALDLPEHRKHARDACERMSMLPLVMEQMPASPADGRRERERPVRVSRVSWSGASSTVVGLVLLVRFFAIPELNS